MNAILTGVDITNENNNQFTNTVIDELIRETLKNEKLLGYNISVSDDEYLMHENIFFDKTKLNKNEVINVFEANKVRYKELEKYLIDEISWQKLVSGMYYKLTSTTEVEIFEIMSKNPNISIEMAENIIIQRQLDLKSNKMIRDMFNEATIEYK